MITVMPALEILKAFTDFNIQGPAAEERIAAFEIANELIAEANFDILIPSQAYNKILSRMNDDHKAAFNSLYLIDDSTENNTVAFDVEQAIRLLAKVESKARAVIILTNNPQVYSSLQSDRIKVMEPREFIAKATTARSLKKRGIVSSIDDALGIIFFRSN